jgi:hypothetical protein
MSTAARVWAGIGVLILIGTAVQSQDDGPTITTTRTPATRSTSVVVEYSVTGTARQVSLTLENDSGGVDQMNRGVPWRQQYKEFSRGDFVYLSAQNQEAAGSLTCEIKVNGVVEFKGSASGGYTICTASGSVP